MNMMNKIFEEKEKLISSRFERCLETSKRINWVFENDVQSGRILDSSHDFLYQEQ